MIKYYILEEYISDRWLKVREFTCNDFELAKSYLLVYRNKNKNYKYRLVGVFSV